MKITESGNLAARKYAPQIGLDLTQRFPERLSELYRSLHTVLEIITLLEIQDLYPNAAFNTLINAVTYALKGYDAQDPVASDIAFSGLISREEFAQIHGKLLRPHGLKLAELRWKETGWTQEEIEYLLSLANSPEYTRPMIRKRGKSCCDYVEITNAVNAKFHDGKPGRTIQAVKGMMSRCGAHKS